MVRLTAEEEALLAGDAGEARQWAMRQLLDVARFFDAEDLVPVTQVHLMADGEAVGEAGADFLAGLAARPAEEVRVRVPTITDPRGVDFARWRDLRQDETMVTRERRVADAFARLGFLLTNTCINYQMILPPALGEHVAFGDTGSSIYANSVLGARTNFEGGPSALAAALTGRVPRYGFHLDAVRRGDTRFVVETAPRDLADWGALGALVGRHMRSYFETPVIEGIAETPGSDALKHFGAALASFGSTPLFHMVGVTPEAPDLEAAFQGTPPEPARRLGQAEIEAFFAAYRPEDGRLDVVVFAAPQLSLFETEMLARLLDGRRVDPGTALLAAVPPAVKADADRLGLTATIEAAGGVLLEGVCFYQMHAREIGEAKGWRRLMSNSAKLINILGGYGYEPFLGSMEACVDSAVAGRIVR